MKSYCHYYFNCDFLGGGIVRNVSELDKEAFSVTFWSLLLLFLGFFFFLSADWALLIFCTFTIMGKGVVFFAFILPGFYCICGLHFLIKCRKFSAIIFLYIFFSDLLSLFSWYSNCMYVKWIILSSHWNPAYYFFFIFLIALYQFNVYWCFFKFINHCFSAVFNLLLISLNELLLFHILYFFISRISIWFFFFYFPCALEFPISLTIIYIFL